MFQREARRLFGSAQERLPAGNCPYDAERFLSRRHRVGQRFVGRLVSPVLSADEEPQKRPALPGIMIADRPAQHWIPGLERIQDRALGDLAVNLQLNVSTDARESAQMIRKHYLNHGYSRPLLPARSIFARLDCVRPEPFARLDGARATFSPQTAFDRGLRFQRSTFTFNLQLTLLWERLDLHGQHRRQVSNNWNPVIA